MKQRLHILKAQSGFLTPTASKIRRKSKPISEGSTQYIRVINFVLSTVNDQVFVITLFKGFAHFPAVRMVEYLFSPGQSYISVSFNPTTHSQAIKGPGESGLLVVCSTQAAGQPVVNCALFPPGNCTFKLALLFQGLCLLA